ncbi:pentatricopeptide repeat-containing protein At4g16470 [Benincasa hispida]|uniref:pentatricopeptide repeat-containing protein At4g16470 n=1 Tax=Benincasa hispida TaxID=102211 RepID=UPI0018FFAF9D|nr:pentatricopeptide repeat-containing protein At4g16470 [Benincasa hispida]
MYDLLHRGQKSKKERNNEELIICSFFYTTQNLRHSYHSAARASPISHHHLPFNPNLFSFIQMLKCASVVCRPSFSGVIHLFTKSIVAAEIPIVHRRRRHKSESAYPSFQVKPHQKEDTSFWDKTLRGLCSTGRLPEAVALLCCMALQFHSKTYRLLLQECIFRKEYMKGKRIHAQMVVVGHVPNEYINTKLLILYAKSGDLETAYILHENLLEKSLVSWNSLIAGYVQKGLGEVGLEFYFKMRQSGLLPDQYTFASVLRACASLASLEHGKRAHGVLIKCQIGDNVVVSSALVDMYFKCSSLSDGHKAFNKSSNRNVITWTALISGYGQHGRVFEVLESFHSMINEGYRPNYVTFLAVLAACGHGGFVSEALRYFSLMTKMYGIKPRGQHYAAMVDLLARAGRLQEAYNLVLDAPCKEHSVMWGALVGGCKVHEDIDLMKHAAANYFELDPENSGKFVVFSNAFATSGLWDNVEEIRAMMKKSGMSKDPGYSRIEIQREFHFFVMSDKSHQQTEEIYRTINSITPILKDAGYTPELCGH